MAKGYLSNRQKNLKIGISSYTDNDTALEVIGKVGIGTNNATSNLHVIGNIKSSNSVYVDTIRRSTNNSTNTKIALDAGSLKFYAGNGVTPKITVNGGVGINTNINVTGIATASKLFIDGDARVTGVLTVGQASITIDGDSNIISVGNTVVINSQGLQISGNSIGYDGFVGTAATIGNVQISSGIVTATSGIVTYYGDGQYLTGVVSGVGIATEGGTVGSGATILDFRGAGISTVTVSSGIATINIVGGSSGGGASVSISTEAPSNPSEGDLWYNSVLGRTFIYYVDDSSSQWVDSAPFNIPEPASTPGKSSYTFTATEGQTEFTVSYTAGYIDVFLNGIRLNSAEYLASNGSSVTLVQEATAGDVLDVVEYRMGIGDTGPQGSPGPLSGVTSSTSNETYYPLVVSGVGSVSPYVTTTSNYFEFTPESGTLKTNQLVVSGIATATDFDSSSDLNLKENVQVIENAIDKLVEISGVTFEWKETKQVSAGVIAQDVEKVFPEVVKTNEYKTVNYSGLIGLLVEAVKEQQEQINTLTKRIETLEGN